MKSIELIGEDINYKRILEEISKLLKPIQKGGLKAVFRKIFGKDKARYEYIMNRRKNKQANQYS